MMHGQKNIKNERKMSETVRNGGRFFWKPRSARDGSN